MSATVSNTMGTVTNVARSVALAPKRNDDTPSDGFDSSVQRCYSYFQIAFPNFIHL